MDNDRPPTPAFIRKEKAKFLAECQKKVCFCFKLIKLKVTSLYCWLNQKYSTFVFIYKLLKSYIFIWYISTKTI